MWREFRVIHPVAKIQMQRLQSISVGVERSFELVRIRVRIPAYIQRQLLFIPKQISADGCAYLEFQQAGLESVSLRCTL